MEGAGAAAAARLAEDGPNELPSAERRNFFRIVLDVLKEPMLLLLLAGGVIYLALGSAQEALLLIVFASLSIVITVCDSAVAEQCPVFFGGSGGQPVKVHWGYPDPSNAAGGEEGQRKAFELTRQALGYKMLQLLALPLETMGTDALRRAVQEIGRA